MRHPLLLGSEMREGRLREKSIFQANTGRVRDSGSAKKHNKNSERKCSKVSHGRSGCFVDTNQDDLVDLDIGIGLIFLS